MRKSLHFLLFALLLSFSVSGQNKKAIKAYENAKRAIQQDDFDLALSDLEKALKADETYVQAYLLKGDILLTKNQPKEASVAYAKAIEHNGGAHINYKLGVAQMKAMDYANAETTFLTYLNYDKVRPETRLKVEHYLENCAFAKVAINNPVPFNPVSVGDGINNLYYQYHPSISIDGKLLVYTQLDVTGGREDENFYYALKEDGKWGQGRKMEGSINSRHNEGVQSLTADGKFMFYTICDREDSKGSCDIYMAKYLGKGVWSQGKNLGDSINSRVWESQPSVSPDGNTLFFVRGKNMRDKDTDLYYSIRTNGKWSKAKPMGENINTPYREMSPFIHFDNQTLYFASMGHPGFGDADLFVSRKQADGSWGEPENLGYPINTPYEEFGLVVSANGKTAYYASDKVIDEGRTRNIYEFELPTESRASPVAWLKGKVSDKETGKPLSATVEVIDLKSGLPWLSVRASEKGNYFAVLPANAEYALNIDREGYLFYSANVSLGDQTFEKALNHPAKLSPIKAGYKLVLNNIFFDYDSYQLQTKSDVELKKLVDFLNINKNVKIRIDGHTDNQGGKEYNKKLSTDRANSVKQYLVDQGISAKRISIKGFGDSVPIATNDTEEGRKLNRRTEVTILE